MSARELLKQVKALKLGERRKLLNMIKTLEQPPAKGAKRTRKVKWPDVEARARRIFGNKTLPNLVLLEREEERY